MASGLLAAWLWCVSAAVAACPLCLGAGQQTKAQQLVTAQQAVLALPTADPSRFRVIEVVKGERPSSKTVEGGYGRFGPAIETAAPKSDKLVLLVREDPLPVWSVVGTIGAEHLGLLRRLGAGKRAADMSAGEWRARVALMLPYLEHHDKLVADMAYGELATAPYAALFVAKPRLAASTVRHWLADPSLGARESLYTLLLGITGNADDAAAIERRLDAAWAHGDEMKLGALIAADLQLRGVERMAWVDDHYLRDPRRSTHEIEAALLALSAHGTANSAIPRVRVIDSYRLFIREHKDIAGYVAQDLASWQYWDAVPEYVALMKSDVRQQYPSQIAIVGYLRQSPGGGQRFAIPQLR